MALIPQTLLRLTIENPTTTCINSNNKYVLLFNCVPVSFSVVSWKRDLNEAKTVYISNIILPAAL